MYDDVFGEERVFLENNYLLFVQIRWYIAWFIKSAMWTGRDLPLNLHSSRLWYPGNFWKINVGGVGMPSSEAASIKIFQMFHGRWRWGVVDDGDWHLALKDLQGRWEFWGVYPWCFFWKLIEVVFFLILIELGQLDVILYLMILPECCNDKLLGLEVCSTGPTVVHLDKEAPSKVQWPIVPSLVMVLVSKWSDASALGMRSHSSGTGHLLETWSDACRMPSMLLWGKACSRLDSPVSLWGMLTDVSFEVFDTEGGSNSHLKQDKDSAFDDSLKPSFSITWWLVATSSEVSLQCMNHEINTR